MSAPCGMPEYHNPHTYDNGKPCDGIDPEKIVALKRLAAKMKRDGLTNAG